MNDSEFTTGGSKIYRHDKIAESNMPDSEDVSTVEIDAHIGKYLGPPATVLHEIVSEYVHIDVHVVEPTPENNFYTLVTSGMSDKPMNSPFPDLRYAELVMCLPSDWPLSREGFQDPRNYWPIAELKSMARFPHVFDTWLWETHTVPNGQPPEPFASNTGFCGMLVAPLVLFDKGFRKLEVRPDKIIHFFGLIPLYRDEMNYKLKNGAAELYGKFGDHIVSELLDISRKNTCRKKFLGLF